MNMLDYALAGYNGRESERPPYASSPVGMAFQCGVWCKQHNITPLEIKPGRGYNWIVNRTFQLNFKDSDTNPKVTRI